MLHPPRIQDEVGKNWITRFLNRHHELVAKFSSQIDKQRHRMSDPVIINSQFSKIRILKQKHATRESNMYNVDEKGFRQGMSDRAKVNVR